MRVWTNKRTGKRYHKGDYQAIKYRNGRVKRGPIFGYSKYRNKKAYRNHEAGSYADRKWAGYD